MKKMVLTSILFTFYFPLVAQNITNSTLTSNCVGNGFIAPTCVTGWYASSGSPMVLGDIKLNTWAAITASPNKAEGIYTNYNFSKGKTYKITFKVKTETNTQNSFIKIKATTGLKHTATLKTESSKESDELIWSREMNTKSSNWESISIKFTPSKNNYQLWLFPAVSSSSKTDSFAQIEIDDIEVSNTDKNAVVVENNKVEVKTSTNFSKTEYIFPETISKGDYLNVRVNTNEVKEIQIIDLAGNIFKTNFTILNRNYIKLLVNSKTIQEGTYIVKIIKTDNTSTTKKLIVI